jgi:nucleoside-diphosphate-sugar epimerase
MPFGHPTTSDERLEQLEVSAMGTAVLTEALAWAGCSRLVHVGSSLEYGNDRRTLDEEAHLAPATPRGAAKAAATLVCLSWARALELSAIVLRPFSVYGPGEPAHRLVPTAFRAALDGDELTLTRRGLVHDFVYVDDVARAITLALTAPADQRIVNIGSGVQTTNEELVGLVERVTGREIRLSSDRYPEQAHDRSFWKADVALARDLLGWMPATGLEDGLRKTLSALQLDESVTRT